MDKKVMETLHQIIDEKGPASLEKNPCKVYNRLLSEEVKPLEARLVLTSLLAGAPTKAPDMDEIELTEYLQKECGLLKKTASQTAAMYKRLLGEENRTSWEEK